MRGGEEKDMTIRLLENENGSPSTTLAPRSFRTLMHSTSLFTSHYITLHYITFRTLMRSTSCSSATRRTSGSACAASRASDGKR